MPKTDKERLAEYERIEARTGKTLAVADMLRLQIAFRSLAEAMSQPVIDFANAVNRFRRRG